jgi:hypothetical protein
MMKKFIHLHTYYLFFWTRSGGIGTYPNADLVDLPDMCEDKVCEETIDGAFLLKPPLPG